MGLLSVYGCARRTNSEVECFHWGLLRKFNARQPIFWGFINNLYEIINSYCVELKQIENEQETRRRKAKFSKAVDNAIRDAEEKLQNERINTTEFLIRVGGATEISFRKMELLKEFEKRRKIMLPMILLMIIIMIKLIYFVRRIMKKITICAQVVMRNLLLILFNHADIRFVPTVFRKINYVYAGYPIM